MTVTAGNDTTDQLDKLVTVSGTVSASQTMTALSVVTMIDDVTGVTVSETRGGGWRCLHTTGEGDGDGGVDQ